jgi:hypothetical protein
MKRYFYFSARFIKNERMAYATGILESDNGYFDFVKAAKDIAQEEGVDVKKVIIVFWTETNSIMKDKFKALKEEENW